MENWTKISLECNSSRRQRCSCGPLSARPFVKTSTLCAVERNVPDPTDAFATWPLHRVAEAVEGGGAGIVGVELTDGEEPSSGGLG